MAPSKGLLAQRDELLEVEFRQIRERLDELKTSLSVVATNLDSVRVAELAAIRANVNDMRNALTNELAKHEAEIKLLRYQMGRTSAVWSLVSGGVASAIVAAIMALILHH